MATCRQRAKMKTNLHLEQHESAMVVWGSKRKDTNYCSSRQTIVNATELCSF
eukprot:m.74226 g.74226  ORF g.74226 m.74226 type:complete len:52 (-) comp13929_c1_seq1:83-238(-)